jgi:hypothetical protein
VCGGEGEKTHKVGLGGLCELLFGAGAHVGIWDAVSRRGQARRARGEGGIPGERVPSNTWLMSMIVGGRAEERGGGCRWEGEGLGDAAAG